MHRSLRSTQSVSLKKRLSPTWPKGLPRREPTLLGSPERLQMTDNPKAILGTPIRFGPVQDQKREQAPWLPRWRGKLLVSDRGSMPKAYEFLLREERQDVKGGTTQPVPGEVRVSRLT